ncbi:MAG: inositol-1-monophosphatase [Gammaproteobacteria bacterium]|nr:MAG: inositol-1-monophosphatase [Gammaproteobacteria bacterium]
MHPLVNIAVSAARQASRIILHSMDNMDKVKTSSKGHNDFVTSVDKKSEQIIIDTIKAAYPEHSILAEESGEQPGNDITWIIDPLDGTTNFLYELPHFAISIAVAEKGRIQHGVIYDPVRDELFTASRGRGAALNGRRLRVVDQKVLSNCLLGTGFPFRDKQMVDTYMGTFKDFMTQCRDIRRAGSAALDLAYVAAGRLDGFWEFGLSKWDIAAGSLMIQEAGGIIDDMNGRQQYLENGNVIAAPPKVFQAMAKTIRPHIK